MSQAELPQSVALRHYVQVVRRGWLVVVACVLVGVAVAGGLLALAPPRATATSLVSLNVITADPFSASRPASALVDVQAEAQAAGSWAVAERTAKALQTDPQLIRQSLTVTPVGDTTLLRISSTHVDADWARAIADATAAAFLDYRQEQAQTRIEQTLQESTNRLAPLQEELRQLNLVIAEAEPGSPEATQAEADRSLTTAEINAYFETTSELRAIDTTGGSILNPAASNAVRLQPNRSLMMTSGALAGLGIGILGTFLANAVRSRVRDSYDVTRASGHPVLGELRDQSASVPVRGSDLAQLRAAREHFLSHPLTAAHVGVCVVVDHSHQEHASDVALNFALVVADSGLQVEYVALDGSELRRQEVIDQVGLRPRDSVSVGRLSSPDNAALTVFFPAQDVVTRSQDELVSREVRAEIAERRNSALVILPVPPNTPADTRLAAFRLADVALLVAESKHTTSAQLSQTVAHLDEFGTPVVGSVIVHHRRARRATHARPPAARFRASVQQHQMADDTAQRNEASTSA